MLMAVALPVAAHHSFSAEFDATKQVTLEGKVVQMEWVNPHSWLTIDVTKADGTVERWQHRRRIAIGVAAPGLEQEFAARWNEDQGYRFPGEGRLVSRQLARHRVSGRPENGYGRLGNTRRTEKKVIVPGSNAGDCECLEIA